MRSEQTGATRCGSKMEEYLQYVKTLRCQLNDVEDQASKVSVDEQMQVATLQSLETDLAEAKANLQKHKDKTEQMTAAKGQVCSQIMDKRRKVASLESDFRALMQTLELVHQERVNLSSKLVDKSTFYGKVAENMNAKFQQLQEYLCSQSLRSGREQHDLVKDESEEEKVKTGEKDILTDCLADDNMNGEARNKLVFQLGSAKAKLDEVKSMKMNVAAETMAIKQHIEQIKGQENEFQEEIRAMDVKTLENEHKSLLTDLAGETKFLQSLQSQIANLQGLSHIVKCTCGEEYKIELESL